MSTHPFPVQHSILDENALAGWAASHYPLRAPLRCRFLRGSMSDVYRLESPDAAYILKVYLHNRHPKSAIQAEIDFLLDLLDHDIPVAAPRSNNDAAYVNEIDAPEGPRCAVLFEAIDGEQPQEVNLAHSRSFGELAGRLHNCADASAKKYDRWHLDEKYLVETPLAYLKPYLENRKGDWEYLCALGRDLVAELHGLVSRKAHNTACVTVTCTPAMPALTNPAG